MSIQIGSSTLTTYRNYKEQLALSTTSNIPIVSLDSSHSSNNVLIRTGKFTIGQSNADFIIGYSNARTSLTQAYNPALQFIEKTRTIKFYHNIDASNINSVVGKLDVLSAIDVPKITTSNIVIIFNSNVNLPNVLQEPEFVVRTPLSNLFVINGYNNNSYFTGSLGVGTTIPLARLHALGLRGDGSSRLENVTLDTISFNNYPGTTFQIDAGTLRLGRNARFDSNVQIDGNLTVNKFEIINLSTNEGEFRGLTTIQNALNIQNTCNERPSLHLSRVYIQEDALDASNISNLQPITRIQYVHSNTSYYPFVIDPVGKIGIGTSMPEHLLDIYAYSKSELGLSPYQGLFGIHGTYGEDVLSITSNVFLGIGTTSPRYNIDIRMHSNQIERTQSPAFINISNTSNTVLWLSSNGNFGIHTKSTKDHVALKVQGVFETDYLSVHRIIPIEGADVHFTNCNIDNVNNLNASNAFLQTLRTSNIYADFISASNYDLLAFNSFLATKELQFELDDLIFSGRTFILSSGYQSYFEKIGATNPFGGLEGTTDPNLTKKPTDKLNIAKSGKIHIIADGVYNTVQTSGGDDQYQKINHGLVITSSNLFTGVNNLEAAPFVHVEGYGVGGGKKRVGGYSVGITNPNIVAGDAFARLALEQNPVEGQLAIDACTMSIKPYSTATRRIGWRYSYTDDMIHTPKIFITGSVPELELAVDNNVINSTLIPLSIYSQGNIRMDARDKTPLLQAIKNIESSRTTVALGGNILGSATDYMLEVNGNAKITRSALIQSSLTVNSNIYAKSVISQTSDARLKENLAIIDQPLEKISQLTGYTFDRTDLRTRDAGLLAQDVLRIMPEIVSQSDDGYYALSYGNMAGLFVECIKKLTDRIEDLEKQVKLLQSRC